MVEDSTLIAEGNAEDDEAVIGQALLQAAAMQSPGAVSHISGETLGTQGTAPFGATTLDIEEVNYILPLLDATADGVLTVVAPTNIDNGDLLSLIAYFRNFESKANNMLQRREANFNIQYNDLNTEGAFLRPDIFIASIMRVQEVPRLDASLYRPDEIIYKANLTNMARQVAIADRDSDDTYIFLRELTLAFPDAFLSRLGIAQMGLTAIGSSNLQRDTLNFALELRTQLLIATLIRHKDEPGFNPNDFFGQAFFKPTAANAEPELQSWGIEQNNVEPGIWQDFQQKVSQQLDDIRGYFSYNDNNLVDFNGLDDMFPFEGFQIVALQWASKRRDELNLMIQEHGGAQAIADMFEEMTRTGKVQKSLPKSLATPRRAQPANRGKRGAGRGKKQRTAEHEK